MTGSTEQGEHRLGEDRQATPEANNQVTGVDWLARIGTNGSYDPRDQLRKKETWSYRESTDRDARAYANVRHMREDRWRHTSRAAKDDSSENSTRERILVIQVQKRR